MLKQPKVLDKVEMATPQQEEFGKTLGLDLTGCSLGVAEAKLQDLIDEKFYGVADPGHPTDKQCEAAAEFGFDITNATRRVGHAIVNDIFDQLNRESIDGQNLKPGDTVKKRWDSFDKEYVISSIADDGSVYFKGGQGHRAWARNVIKEN